MALGYEAKEDHTTCPDINCAGLVLEEKERFRRHVSLSTRAVADFHLFLQLSDPLNLVIFRVLAWLRSYRVNLELRKTKVYQKPSVGPRIVQKVSWLDIAVHNTPLCEVLDSGQKRVHVVLNLD